MMTRSSAYRFSQGHHVWNSWERASRTMMNSKGLNSLGECPLSHWNLLLAFSYMFCVSRTTRQACEEPTRWHIWVHNRMPFPDRQSPCTVSYWRNKTFTVIGEQWIWHLWCCVQAWNQTSCHWCTLVVVESFQPPSLEPSWPGPAVWGLDKFLLTQGRHPCPCRGRRW